MLTVRDLAARPDFAVRAVDCLAGEKPWSTKVCDSHFLVIVRHGRFSRRVDGVVTAVDPTVAFAGSPGEEEHFAHPAGGDDFSTWIDVAPDLWHGAPTSTPIYVDARIDLLHRRLLAARDIDFALAEDLLALLSAASGQTIRNSPADAHIAATAREAIIAGDPAAVGLMPLARQLGVSPYRLSRAFTRELGVSLSRYRNRVRVGQVMDRLEQGESHLADLAAELGFADHAHLSRTVRQHLGETPTALRRLLTA